MNTVMPADAVATEGKAAQPSLPRVTRLDQMDTQRFYAADVSPSWRRWLGDDGVQCGLQSSIRHGYSVGLWLSACPVVLSTGQFVGQEQE